MSFKLTELPTDTLSEDAVKLAQYFQDIMGDHAQHVTLNIDVGVDVNRNIDSAHVKFTEDEINIHRINAAESERAHIDQRGMGIHGGGFGNDSKTKQFREGFAETPVERFSKLFEPELETFEKDNGYGRMETKTIEHHGQPERNGYRFDISTMKPPYHDYATNNPNEAINIPGKISAENAEEFINGLDGNTEVNSSFINQVKNEGLTQRTFDAWLDNNVPDKAERDKFQTLFDTLSSPPENTTREAIHNELADLGQEVWSTLKISPFNLKQANSSPQLETKVIDGGNITDGKNSKTYRVISLLNSLGLPTSSYTYGSTQGHPHMHKLATG